MNAFVCARWGVFALILLSSATAIAQVPVANVAGLVWKDLNGNGIVDAGEPGAAGINVFLLDGPVILMATTDSSGLYQFSDQELGEHAIVVSSTGGGLPGFDLGVGSGANVPPGWTPTSDPDGIETRYFAIVQLGAEGLTGQDFGFKPDTRVITAKRTDPPQGDAAVRITSGSAAGATLAAAQANDAFAPPVPPAGLSGVLEATEPLSACGPVSNDLSGKIALIQRGACVFQSKIQNALNAGAVAAVILNNFNDDLTVMAGSPPVLIPAVFVGITSGQSLLDAEGETATLLPNEPPVFSFNSSFGSFQVTAFVNGTHDSGDVGAGSAWVAEQPQPGWVLQEASCQVSNMETNVATETGPESIALEDGGLAICTFLNTETTIPKPVPLMGKPGLTMLTGLLLLLGLSQIRPGRQRKGSTG